MVEYERGRKGRWRGCQQRRQREEYQSFKCHLTGRMVGQCGVWQVGEEYRVCTSTGFSDSAVVSGRVARAELQHPFCPRLQNVVSFGILQEPFEINPLLYPVSFRNLSANSLPLF